MIKIAINGFGRIGRAAFKIAVENPDIEIVAINDLTDTTTLAHLLKYDTAYGTYSKKVTHTQDCITVAGRNFKILAEKEPAKLPWNAYNVDVVLECTGRFVKDDAALAHIAAGAKRVVVSAPAKGNENTIKTFLIGVNDKQYNNQEAISNASCTTNCIAPIMAVLNSKFKIVKSAMTTVHATTADQNIVDGPHRDLRRARTAGYNIIPTSTGAAIATTKVIPELENKFDGIAIRVPVIVGSIIDLTALVERETTVEEVNQAFTEACQNPFYKNVLEVTEEPIVSADIIKNPKSAIIDLSMTKVIDGDLIKVLAWYDNEWGYSNRLVEMATYISTS